MLLSSLCLKLFVSSDSYSTASTVNDTFPFSAIVATGAVVIPSNGVPEFVAIIAVKVVPAVGFFGGHGGVPAETNGFNVAPDPVEGISKELLSPVICNAAQDFAALITCVSAALAFALFCWFRKAGRATAERTPMMMTTISSSTRVKPFSIALVAFLRLSSASCSLEFSDVMV